MHHEPTLLFLTRVGAHQRHVVQNIIEAFLPPANEVCGGYVFTGVCLSTGVRACMAGGVHGGVVGSVRAEGCAWQGACVAGGHAWQEVCMAGETATAAGDMHHTGMLSCL